jgi:hypothetical protein
MSSALSRPILVNGVGFAALRTTLAAEQACAIRGLGPDWQVPAALHAKVDAQGRFRPFFGDTVIMPVAAERARELDDLARAVTTDLRPLFAEPLAAASFHVTLHDLVSASAASAVALDRTRHRRRAREIFDKVAHELRLAPELATLSLRPTLVYPCLNISVLLGLEPASERDFRTLYNFHALLDELKPLDYWLRPHVTLAYFQPRPLASAEVGSLSQRLQSGLHLPEVVTLDLFKTAYAEFSSMAAYESIFDVGGVSQKGDTAGARPPCLKSS